MNFDFYATLVAMVVVLLLGVFVIKRVKFLRDYNIPEPVVGGSIAAIILFILHSFFSIDIKFDGSMKDPLMLAFFSSIGLLADFASLKKGGKKLAIFLVVVVGLLFAQNIVGIGVATAMGQNPLMGLIAGSVTMSGGHGTGAAWAAEFVKEPYMYSSATTIAIACATFGLISGGIIGGPVARYLVNKYKLVVPKQNDDKDAILNFQSPQKERLITPSSFIESLALIALCLLIGSALSTYIKTETGFTLPTFVYCLFTGVVLRNVLSVTKIHHVFDREVSVLGNVSLSLFLALALMTINLWDLVTLALPMLVILVVQVAMMVAYAIFITFKVCGKDYDAAVLAAGHCGFGLGATPTAMVNMQTVTNHYGMSHMAFIIVPLVGAFFIDIVNALVINAFLYLPFFH
ncbi:sodium/glutamate symporter [Campylobacter armoricus]|uniref:sodium/glutamate symporter n=1 Tax=Campylobacter armoricus TaxID=2505970 RepID=UPI001116B66F|nr:sodium/glutamate symporter [Campylobacter armoricus]